MLGRISSFGRALAAGFLVLACASITGGAGIDRFGSAPPVALDVPYLVTPHDLVDRMLQMAEVGPDDYVVDLGTGDGRMVIAAARDYGARGLGVDVDPERVAEAQINAGIAGVAGQVSFRRENLFDTELSDADVVTMYLLSSVNLRLRPRLLEELRPGTRVVSHAFQMGAWQADEMVEVEGRRAYLWIVPAIVEGNWRIENWGGEVLSLTFTQNYQSIDGAARQGNGFIPLAEARLRGDRIRFVLDDGNEPRIFAGRIEDGVILPDDNSETWRIVRRP